MGIVLLSFGVWSSTSGPPRGMLKKDENRIILLESGKITEAEVTKRYYQLLPPQGWKIVYRFKAEEPANGKDRTYWGSAQGPKKYYSTLLAGNPVTIIYNPLSPKVNCEVKYF